MEDEFLIGDRLRLEQILVNCLSNAIKFTPSGGKITLEVMEAERHVNKVLYRFIVTDTGKGMSEDFIDRLFIPFEQEDTSIARKYGGSGLGMSITKNLVSLMGGNIKVTSNLGKGTVLTIDIVFEISDLSKEEPDLQAEKETKAFDFTGRRILIVEDNEINQEITCEILKSVHASVEIAKDGYSALKLFTDASCGYYDLIIMDVQMPGLNGYETAKAIRKSGHPDADTIIIIAMSADTYADDLTFNSDSGMNYHMAKPIDLDYLYSLLNNIFTKDSGD
jgi:CheY-like chemotaxis protein